jgi:YegS/Rv2252/BmrU family lipid kinase
MNLPKQAILVVNSASRRGADAFVEARDKLVAGGLTLIEAHAVEEPQRMGDVIADAVTKAPMVIVGGGDGSLSTNIEHFMGRDTIFALLPLGTANSFARTMGIPLDVDGAVDVIVNGEARPVSLGCINGDYFLNAAAMGLAPMVAGTVPHGLKRRLGRAGYLLWAGWSAANFKAFRLIVHDGHHEHRLWATEVRIANGRFHGGMELIESADPENPYMIVQAVKGRSVLNLGWSYFASALKLAKRNEMMREFRARHLRVTTRPRQQVSIDGEVGPWTPLDVSAAAAAVTMAAPTGSPTDQ